MLRMAEGNDSAGYTISTKKSLVTFAPRQSTDSVTPAEAEGQIWKLLGQNGKVCPARPKASQTEAVSNKEK